MKSNKLLIIIVSFLFAFFITVNTINFHVQSQDNVSETIRIGALKGPTGMGLAKLMEDSQAGDEKQFTLTGTADEIVTGLVKGELDFGAVPCNLASVLYHKTNGGIKVAAINALGVLYVLENGNTIHSVQDLKGKTIYTTGKGTTPEYVFRYILTKNGIDPDKDVEIIFKSESTEIASMFASEKNLIALLPQPYVTTVQMQQPDVRIALDLTQEWEKVSPDHPLATGCVVVRTELTENDPETVKSVLSEMADSVSYVNQNVDDAAALIAKFGIIPNAEIAKKAIPYCNITFIHGEEMQKALSEYLTILFEANPVSVGEKLPDEAFYFKY